jgi:hypothetical protein
MEDNHRRHGMPRGKDALQEQARLAAMVMDVEAHQNLGIRLALPAPQ